MKYTVSVDIALPRHRVIELLDDASNLPRWQRNLLSFEQISGEPGQVGSTMRLTFKWGRGTMEILETITRRDLPDVLDTTYETSGVWNAVRSRFVETGPESTRWEGDNELRFDAWYMRLMGRLMPGAFRRQSLEYMEDFKAFAEQGRDVREEAAAAT